MSYKYLPRHLTRTTRYDSFVALLKCTTLILQYKYTVLWFYNTAVVKEPSHVLTAYTTAACWSLAACLCNVVLKKLSSFRACNLQRIQIQELTTGQKIVVDSSTTEITNVILNPNVTSKPLTLNFTYVCCKMATFISHVLLTLSSSFCNL